MDNQKKAKKRTTKELADQHRRKQAQELIDAFVVSTIFGSLCVP